jgi:hypothetical protein
VTTAGRHVFPDLPAHCMGLAAALKPHTKLIVSAGYDRNFLHDLRADARALREAVHFHQQGTAAALAGHARHRVGIQEMHGDVDGDRRDSHAPSRE